MGCVSRAGLACPVRWKRLLASRLYIYNAKLSKKVESAKFFTPFFKYVIKHIPETYPEARRFQTLKKAR